MSRYSKNRKGILLPLLAAFLYSIMQVMARLLGNNGIPPISQVSLRYVIAFLFFGEIPTIATFWEAF